MRSGAALKKLSEIVAAQGGCAGDVYKTLPLAKNVYEVRAPESGYVQVSALALGRACAEIGGGRAKEGDEIDHAAGIILKKRQGERAEKGEPLAEIYYNGALKEGGALAESAFRIGDKKIQERPLVYTFVGGKRS